MLDWKNINGWLVLVVDDEPDNLEVVATVLSFFGMKVKTANDGLQALEVLANVTPTLMLLDLAMPHMDGWRLLQEIKNIHRLQEVPVVALTAHAMIGDEERILEAGFDGYLSKPVNLPTLIQDIEQALAKKVSISPLHAPEISSQVEPLPPDETTSRSEQLEKTGDKTPDNLSLEEISQ